MKTVYRYPLLGSGMFSVIKSIYKGAVPLHVGIAQDQICIWFQINTDNEFEERKIHIRGTGQPFTGEEGAYIGTIITPSNMVWHYFDESLLWDNQPWSFNLSETAELNDWEKEILEDSNPLFPETTYVPSKN